MKLHVLFPLHFKTQRISYTCWHLSVNMDAETMPTEIHVPSFSNVPHKRLFRTLPGNQLWRLIAKANRDLVTRTTEKVFLSRVQKGDVVYLWTNISDQLIEDLKEKEVLIIKEKINSLKIDSIRILNDVYERAGMKTDVGLSREEAEAELRQFDLIDHIFVANPIAEQGFYAQGIPREKILSSSYGWDPARFGNFENDKPKESPFILAFLGVSMLRKGVDLLLEAWKRANVEGQLMLIGTVDEEIRQLCSDLLNREDVTVTGWLENPASALAKADVFAFPTHEEGGPLVTYEAMGLGLPVLTSPYGAGAVARHEKDGYVIDPYSIDEWAEAIVKLAGDRDLRENFAQNAKKQADEFTWQKVGARRREQVLSVLKS
ncbi:MAG: glycosyltransferase family 4 protein [Sneathiellales bacterium]|nr:glycosyltransferase family 4 protein [Sneathiellales bacterium]